MSTSETRADRRTKWDEKADTARSDLLAEGIARILEDTVAALAGLVTPSALARRSDRVSVDRAYRLLGDPEATLVRIMTNAADPEYRAPEIGWDTFDAVSTAAADRAAAAEGVDPIDVATAAIRHYLEQNFRLPSYPLGRIIAAATVTAGPAWKGSVRINPEHRALADELMAIHRSGAHAVRTHMRWVLLGALAALGRRPRPGMSLDLVLELSLALGNGALDRISVEPSALGIDDVIDALVALVLALTEEGSLADPRAPADPADAAAFTQLVSAADAAWASGPPPESVATVAGRAGIDIDRAARFFPRLADLADSVLRVRTAPVGGDPGPPVTDLALLRSNLRRLAETADALPGLIATATAAEPSVLVDLRLAADTLAVEGHSGHRPDDRIAERLIATAGLGTAHWATVEVLLDVLAPVPADDRRPHP